MPTYADLRDKQAELKDRIRMIDTQLAQRKPVGRVSDQEWAEYRSWKGKALYAKACLIKELDETKRQMREVYPEYKSAVDEIANELIDALGFRGVHDGRAIVVFETCQRVIERWDLEDSDQTQEATASSRSQRVIERWDLEDSDRTQEATA